MEMLLPHAMLLLLHVNLNPCGSWLGVSPIPFSPRSTMIQLLHSVETIKRSPNCC